MKSITLEELLEAGCHFGHQVTRQNPKARDYVFEERDRIHIIDLEKTKEGLEEAGAYVKSVASRPDATMIILGAKRQAQEIVKAEVQRGKTEVGNGLYSVTNRWIGGTLTNLGEVSKNFKRLDAITKLFANEYEKAKFTKKELLLMERERQKLMTFYDGITDLTRTPDVVFIIDTHLEHLAVRESKAMNVKVVGITDTNADPTIIDYAIPANDDAVGSIQLITSYIVDAWIEGRKLAAKTADAQAAEAEKAKAATPVAKPAAEAQAPAAAAKPAYKQSAAGREKDKAKDAERKVESTKAKEAKAVGLTEAKKKSTKKTPEKITVE